jgi:hypothetical protein
MLQHLGVHIHWHGQQEWCHLLQQAAVLVITARPCQSGGYDRS